MPYLKRPAKPDLHYAVDDCTDRWRQPDVVVLLHGFGRSSVFWTPWIPYLSRFYRVVSPDLRGLGKSAKPADLSRDISVAEYVEDLAAIVGEVGGGRPVHVCGESLGGILGIVLAAERPALVKSLSLVSAPLFLSRDVQTKHAAGHASWQQALIALGSKGWSEALNTVTRFPPDSDPAMLRWYSDEFGKADVDVLVAMATLASAVDVTPYLSRIQAPVLGLYPTSGPITDAHEGIMQKEIADLRLVHIESRYHMIQMLSPAACANEVRHFISQCDGVAWRD